MKRLITMLITHGAALAVGFALGVYFLPILTAPDSPDAAMLEEKAQEAFVHGRVHAGLARERLFTLGRGDNQRDAQPNRA